MSSTIKERTSANEKKVARPPAQLSALETADGKCTYCGKPLDNCTCANTTEVFDVGNLDCADCATKMETRIAHIPRVKDASVTYTTKQLRVTCPHPDLMRLRFEEECRQVDDDVTLTPHRVSAPSAVTKEGRGTSSAKSAAQKEQNTSAENALDDDEDEEAVHVKQIIVAGIFFAAGEFVEHALSPDFEIASIVMYLIAYVVVGFQIIAAAFKNIRHGKIFDENFLMTVATFGAIAVQQYPEAVGVMLLYRIGEACEDKAVDRSRSQVMDAIDMRPETVHLLENYHVVAEHSVGGSVEVDDAQARKAQTIPAEKAKIGDFLLVAPGERIPLDSVVVEGASRLDTSPITGEPVPVGVGAGDKVTSGCVNGQGMLVIRVEHPLSESMVSRILDTVENAAASKPHMERFISRFARIYTPIVLAIALITAIIPSLVTGDWFHWVYLACTFLVISCPCAIVLSVPLSFFAGIGAAGKLGVLFKGGTVLEALAKIKQVVMDKTGTITKGVFAVNEIRTASDVSQDRANDILALAAAAESISTHPIAQSIVVRAKDDGLTLRTPTRVDEIAGKGVVATIRVKDASRDRISSSPKDDVYAKETNEMSTQSTSVQEMHVACGNAKLMDYVGAQIPQASADQHSTVVHVAIDGTYVGSIYISDIPKPDAKTAIAKLHKLGVHTAMLTGDEQTSAQYIANQVGVDEVKAHLLPSQKLDAMKEIRASKGSVAFVGDGINDAPVLAGADVGMAMGSGSDAAIEAADVVIMNSNMDSVPTSISLARAVQINARENVTFALGVKLLVMVLGFAGIASMWAAVFADSGVALICVLNSIRLLAKRF